MLRLDLLRVQYLPVVSLLLHLKHALLLLEVLHDSSSLLNRVLLKGLLINILLLLEFMLLDLHLQCLIVRHIPLLLHLPDLIKVRLRVHLSLSFFLLLDFRLLLGGHLMRQVDIMHVAVIDFVLLVFSASLVMLIPLLIHEERVPVEVSLAPIKLCVR